MRQTGRYDQEQQYSFSLNMKQFERIISMCRGSFNIMNRHCVLAVFETVRLMEAMADNRKHRYTFLMKNSDIGG